MSSQSVTATDTRVANRHEHFRRKPSWFKRLVGALFFSLCFSVFLEWIGIAFFWPELGADHSEAVVRAEIGYLNDDFKRGLFDSSPSILIQQSTSTVYYYLFELTMLEWLVIWAGKTTGLNHYAQATLNTVQVFFIRLGILIFSLPIFILFALVGASTGLTLRDIRRWSGGREYGRVYHKAKAMAPEALAFAWIIYLTLPNSVHPNVVILPCAALFGLNILIVTASFKKYL